MFWSWNRTPQPPERSCVRLIFTASPELQNVQSPAESLGKLCWQRMQMPITDSGCPASKSSPPKIYPPLDPRETE